MAMEYLNNWDVSDMTDGEIDTDSLYGLLSVSSDDGPKITQHNYDIEAVYYSYT